MLRMERIYKGAELKRQALLDFLNGNGGASLREIALFLGYKTNAGAHFLTVPMIDSGELIKIDNCYPVKYKAIANVTESYQSALNRSRQLKIKQELSKPVINPNSKVYLHFDKKCRPTDKPKNNYHTYVLSGGAIC